MRMHIAFPVQLARSPTNAFKLIIIYRCFGTRVSLTLPIFWRVLVDIFIAHKRFSHTLNLGQPIGQRDAVSPHRFPPNMPESNKSSQTVFIVFSERAAQAIMRNNLVCVKEQQMRE